MNAAATPNATHMPLQVQAHVARVIAERQRLVRANRNAEQASDSTTSAQVHAART